MLDNKNYLNFNFYKNNYRFFSKITIILLIMLFSLLAITFYSKITKPTPMYFATTSDGRLIKITPKPK